MQSHYRLDNDVARRQIDSVVNCNLLCRFYHLDEPRALTQLFTSGENDANKCSFEDGISGIAYTYDLLGHKKYNQHTCSGFQDPCSPVNSYPNLL